MSGLFPSVKGLTCTGQRSFLSAGKGSGVDFTVSGAVSLPTAAKKDQGILASGPRNCFSGLQRKVSRSGARWFFTPVCKGENVFRPHFSLIAKRKTVSSRQKEKRLHGRAQRCFRLAFWKRQAVMRGRIGSASESAAADPVLVKVPGTDLPKMPLNKLTE